VSAHINYLDWNLRLWDWNHTEYFPERVLTSFDGFPISVCGSSNKWVRRLTKSKKYGKRAPTKPTPTLPLPIPLNPTKPNMTPTAALTLPGEHVVTADLGIMLGPGFPVNYTLNLGVRNDHRKWMDNQRRRALVYPWEYMLGDKAYVGCPEFLTEFKVYGGGLTEEQLNWNNTLQFFRGRNEHLVAAVKQGRKAISTQWRGSFAGLAAVLKIIVHMVGLQERMGGPRYDCFGPWPVCPDAIARRYM
jgi:hypothetical protein